MFQNIKIWWKIRKKRKREEKEVKKLLKKKNARMRCFNISFMREDKSKDNRLHVVILDLAKKHNMIVPKVNFSNYSYDRCHFKVKGDLDSFNSFIRDFLDVSKDVVHSVRY